MNSTQPVGSRTHLREALTDARSSVRLRAVLAAGTHPDPDDLAALVDRCGSEPDFFVRDMLTWALTRLPASIVVPRLLDELRDKRPQARSQALHTLSKVGDPRGWPAITPALLRDADDEVARSAWRAAVALVPAGSEAALATGLSAQLGRGDREVQLSLSRAFAALGDDAAEPVLTKAAAHPDAQVRMHALATERFMRDPEAGFDSAVAEAQRSTALEHISSDG